MRVIVAQALGMCFGVRDALAVMRRVETPVEVTVFGELVHNPVVVRELERRGFATLDEAQRSAARIQTAAVLITAHGVSNRERTRFEAEGKRVVDTTCPLVKKAHAAALGLKQAGYFVVVIGKPGHVEVRGLTGDLEEGRFAVVENVAAVRRFGAGKIGVIAQTTTVESEARAVVARIREMNAGAEVRFINTVCMPTRDRQAALEELLGKVDVLVAVGGRGSNNTRQLVNRAREAGVRGVHVEDASELSDGMFLPEEVVGLTAGTSTLPETVEAVRVKLESMHVRTCANAETEMSHG